MHQAVTSGLGDAEILNKFQGERNIPGFYGNFVFFAHGAEYDKSLQGDASTVASYECQLVKEVSRHLLLNNVRSNQMQVMCNNKKRFGLLQRHFQLGSEIYKLINLECAEIGDKNVFQSSCQNKRVTILLLVESGMDQNQGEWFRRSVFHAVANSRNGVIIIASFKIITLAKNDSWKGFINTMFRFGFIHPALRINCETHGLANDRQISCGQDLREASPLGGCLQICDMNQCQHRCGSVCHPVDRDHVQDMFLCKEPCSTKCSNGHDCVRACHELCSCKKGCEFLRSCGHPLDNQKNCPRQCGRELVCGHKCPKGCFRCDKKHEDVECSVPCSRKCKFGHNCGRHPCSTICPPCQTEGAVELRCGHSITRKCADPEFVEEEYECHQPCRRGYGVCNHACKKRCFEDCGICEVKVMKPHPGCRHPTLSLCQSPILDPCRSLVTSKEPSPCGHEVLVPCHLASSLPRADIPNYCRRPCESLLTMGQGDCGHSCSGNCSACHQGRLHKRCQFFCGKQLLCGHTCTISCSLICPPCIHDCILTCEHYSCPLECGVPCDYNCIEPCPYSCEHLRCTKLCGEICDRPGCTEPCLKKLNCGHSCVGFCGEICPEACKTCAPHKFNDFIKMTEDETDRYITIPSCGHCVEEYSLQTWIIMENDHGEIMLKSCPVCMTPIPLTLRRYSSQIQKSWQQVQEVKTKICGDEKEMKERLEKVHRDVSLRLEKGTPIFQEYGEILRHHSKKMKTSNKTGVHFDSMHMDKVNFIEWAADEWAKFEDKTPYYENLWQKRYFENYKVAFGELFLLTVERIWPLHPNEFNAISTELVRMKDMERLYNRLSLEQDGKVLKLGNSREGMERFQHAEAVLLRLGPYTVADQAEFNKRYLFFIGIQKHTLEISKEERKQIVRSFGSRPGRWFKCPNGHVYVVTECGGVTEIGVCNECGAAIGGEDHQLLQFNNLAPEMDGAHHPLYPTMLYRGN